MIWLAKAFAASWSTPTLYLTGLEVPEKAEVSFVDPFYPSFFGFIREDSWFAELDLQPEDFGTGKDPPSPRSQGKPRVEFPGQTRVNRSGRAFPAGERLGLF